MDLSIIIVNYDVYEDVCKCIASIYETINGLSFEIYVTDNNSSDRRIEQINKLYKDVHLIRLNENRGFGAANNEAARSANGKNILFVNPDILFLSNTIEKLYSFLESQPSAGCAAPVIMRKDESIQYYYTFFPSIYSRVMQEFGLYTKAPKMKYRMVDYLNKNIRDGKPFMVDWALGACIMMPRLLFNKLGGFDEAFFLYEEEVDLLFRMKVLRYNTYILPDVRVIHNHNTSTSKLGFAFIRYQGFRSIIIYSIKHDEGIKRFFDKLILTFGIFFRFARGLIFRKYKLGQLRSHSSLFWDLLKLNLKSRNSSDKLSYDFNLYSKLLSLN